MIYTIALPTSCNKSVSSSSGSLSSPSFTLASALILRTDIQNAVAVDLKSDLDLWLPSGSWRDPAKLELAQEVIVLGEAEAQARIMSDPWLANGLHIYIKMLGIAGYCWVQWLRC